MESFKLAVSSTYPPRATRHHSAGTTYSRGDFLSFLLGFPSMLSDLRSGFNLPNFVQAAFKKLQSDVQLSADVTIGIHPHFLVFFASKSSEGDYQTTLQYTQTAVPTATDNSLDLILPVLAQPIVQKLVGGSLLRYATSPNCLALLH